MPVTRSSTRNSSNANPNPPNINTTTSTTSNTRTTKKKRTKKLSTTSPSNSPSTAPSTDPDPNSPIFFWKPTEVPYGTLGQWYHSPITCPLLTFTYHTHPTLLPHQTGPSHPLNPTSPSAPLTFTNCEQFMMAHKAHLFSPTDTTSLTTIMATSDPKDQKALGRQVPNFSTEIWNKHRYEIVRWGNYYKFTQDEELKRVLLDTGDRELVEASPRDRIWGVGFGAKNAEKSRGKWGLNLLGQALMEVRDRIRREEEENGKEEMGSAPVGGSGAMEVWSSS